MENSPDAEVMKLVGRTHDLWLITNRTFEGNLLVGTLLVARKITEKMRGEDRVEWTKKELVKEDRRE